MKSQMPVTVNAENDMPTHLQKCEYTSISNISHNSSRTPIYIYVNTGNITHSDAQQAEVDEHIINFIWCTKNFSLRALILYRQTLTVDVKNITGLECLKLPISWLLRLRYILQNETSEESLHYHMLDITWDGIREENFMNRRSAEGPTTFSLQYISRSGIAEELRANHATIYTRHMLLTVDAILAKRPCYISWYEV